MSLQVRIKPIAPSVYKAPKGRNLRRVLIRFARNYAKELVDEVSPYPPPRAGSKYQRTNNLHDSWKIESSGRGDNFVITVSNDATDTWGRAYAQYVQGNHQQWFHKDTGWINIYDYMKAKYDDYIEAVHDIVLRYL